MRKLKKKTAELVRTGYSNNRIRGRTRRRWVDQVREVGERKGKNSEEIKATAKDRK